jgi:hypothetical protein
MRERLQGLLPIGTHVNLILNKMRCDARIRELNCDEQKPDEAAKDQSDTNKEHESEAHREFVSRRLADLAAFERRANGIKDRR